MRPHIVKPFFHDRIRRASGSGLPASSHCCSPCRRNGSAPFGDAPGGTPRSTGALNDASMLLSGSVGRAVTGPVTMMPDSGRCDVPGGGTHLCERCRTSAVSHATSRSHALPGFPRRPRRAARAFRCPLSSSQARDRTAPSGTSPEVANLHSATSSLRASAIIPRLRDRPSRSVTK